MTISPISAAMQPAPLAAAGRLVPSATTTAALDNGLGSGDTSDLLNSVNALQSLAGLLGSAGSLGMSGSSPTIPPYKPIEAIDQKTVRDSIPDADDASASSGA
jgi:hypothetical protein